MHYSNCTENSSTPAASQRQTKSFKRQYLKKLQVKTVSSAERKGTDKRIDFTNTAKITVSANKFPKVKDSSTAFIERRLFLTWTSEFLEGDKQIQWIERNWIQGEHDERKGILCWMLEGLQRLLTQGHFTTSKSQEETEIAFQRASDTIGAFWAELAIYGKNYATTRAEALKAYEDYCEIYGLVPENDKTFTQRMEDNEKISKGKLKGDRAWKGISFKKLNEDGTEGTDGTLLHDYSPTEISAESSKNVQGVKRVLSVPSVPDNSVQEESQLKVVTEESGLRHIETGKPIWFVKEILQGCKCDCGALNVTKEILTPQKETIHRCSQCFEKLRQTFPNAVWKAAYPEMPSYEEEES